MSSVKTILASQARHINIYKYLKSKVWKFCASIYFNEHYTSNCILSLNILKPTGYVMHQQFNIQQLYVLPTLYLCVLYLSENKQRLVPLTA